MAEEFTLQQLLTEGGAVDRDQPGFRTSAEMMDRPSHQFFAGAAFPFDENGSARGGDLSDRIKDRLHRRRVTDDIFKAVAFGDLGFQGDHFLFDGAAADRPLDHDLQLIDVQRLADIVVGSLFHRLDGNVD